MSVPLPTELRDSFGRTVRNLRISVTDRCNFRCLYCMPAEGLEWLPRGQILSFEEIERVARVAVSLGVEKIRLTGGEPLLRRDLPGLVSRLVAIPGLRDISLTTNGVRLRALAPALASAGLRRVNVSLDALTRERFLRIVRRDEVDEVLQGLEAAAEHFPGPVKVNTVLMRGVNDEEIPAFVRLARERGVVVRFIEFMPLDAGEEWDRSHFLPGAEVRARIEAVLPAGVRLEPVVDLDPSAPSRDWTFSDGAPGIIGCIDSVSSPFCESCDRIRLTADGKIRTCLFSTRETDLLPLLRGENGETPASDAVLAERLVAAVRDKEAGHRINHPDFVRASRSMSQIGG